MPHSNPKNRKDPSLHKVPPQSLEAEESILSAILIDNSTLLDIIDILRPEDFYRTSHQKIFSAVVSLFSNNEPVDLVTLTNALKSSGDLESSGGATYLAKLVDTVPLATHAQHYAKIIHEKASLRRLIENANAIINRCFEDQGDTDEIIDFAESSIFKISESKARKAFSPINELITESIDRLEERQGKNSLITGISTGFYQLDSLTSGLQKSDLIILAARPSMGKTAFALNLARNVAVKENIPVAIFSLEMSKEQLSMRLLTSEARIDSNRLKGGMISPDDWGKITDAADVISQAPVFIDDSANVTAMEIRAKSRKLKMDKGLGLIIVDYLQLMKGPSKGDRRDLEIAEISRAMKSLAKELDIPVVALSQLNRMLEQRSEKRPLLSDLRESGALEQDADIVAFIYRDEVYNKDESNPNKGKAELIVAKNRNGAVGTAHFTFIGAYTRFETAARGDYPE